MSALAKRQAAIVIAPPAVPEAASLIAEVIGEWQPNGEKGACRVARLIEEALIARGWPHDLGCGSEQALAESFGVGRAVVREAVRILEVRGTARMVPGPHGGLRVLHVDRRRTVDFVAGFASFNGVTEAQRLGAARVLARVRQAGADGEATERNRQARLAIDFFEDVVAAIAEQSQKGAEGSRGPSVLLAPEALLRSRAAQIAGLMLRECSAEEWRLGHRLGSEEDLCFRYGVDRDAFRQAVRILESAGAAETNCGRGHGLVSKSPRAGTVARLVSCLFASMGLSADAVMMMFHRLNIEVVALAAARASRSDCDLVDQALGLLEEALGEENSDNVLACVFEAEEAVVQTCENPLLRLIVQSLRAYPTAGMPRDPRRLRDMNRQFLKLSRPLLAALRANDVAEAMRLQQARSEAMAFFFRTF